MIPRYSIYLDQSNGDGHWHGELQRCGDSKCLAEVTGPDCMTVLVEIVDAVSEHQAGPKGIQHD